MEGEEEGSRTAVTSSVTIGVTAALDANGNLTDSRPRRCRRHILSATSTTVHRLVMVVGGFRLRSLTTCEGHFPSRPLISCLNNTSALLLSLDAGLGVSYHTRLKYTGRRLPGIKSALRVLFARLQRLNRYNLNCGGGGAQAVHKLYRSLASENMASSCAHRPLRCSSCALSARNRATRAYFRPHHPCPRLFRRELSAEAPFGLVFCLDVAFGKPFVLNI